MSKVTETVEKIAWPIVQELGLEIVDVNMLKKAKTGICDCILIKRMASTLKNAEWLVKN